VLVHLHNHEWDPEKGLSAPAKFITDFARACIDAGADVFIGQGSHSRLRGIELYKNKPIFYDPGDFMSMSDTVERLPADFYSSPGLSAEIRSCKATPADAFDARKALPKPLNPLGWWLPFCECFRLCSWCLFLWRCRKFKRIKTLPRNNHQRTSLSIRTAHAGKY